MTLTERIVRDTFSHWYVFEDGYRIDWRKTHIWRLPIRRRLTMAGGPIDRPEPIECIEIRARTPQTFHITAPGIEFEVSV